MSQYVVVNIRPLQVQDQEQWRSQWLAYQTFYQVKLSEDINQHTWSQLLTPSSTLFAAVACQGEQVLGFVHYVFHDSTWAIADYCYLEDLYVVPEARGQQVAKGLIAFVQQQAKAKNCARLYWHTQFSNHTAQRLYNWVAENPEVMQYRMALD